MQQLLEVLIGLKDTFSGVERTDQEVLALHVCSGRSYRRALRTGLQHF